VGRLLAAVVAKVLGRDPEDVWETWAKWAIRVCLAIVVAVLVAGAITVLIGDDTRPSQPTDPYVKDGLLHIPNRPSESVG